MLPITVTQRDRLTKKTVLSATPRLVLSANLNRVYEVTSVTNPLLSGTEVYDSLLFPVASVVEAYRPRAGIVKGMTASGSYPTVGVTNGSPDDSTSDSFTYSASVSDPYMYWQSEFLSDSTVSVTYGAGNYDLPNAQIDVKYETLVYGNKLKIVLENTYVSPTQATVSFITAGTPDSYNLSNADKDADGNFVLWYLSTDIWSSTYDPDTDTLKTVSFDEVKVTFSAMDTPNSRAAVIEVAPYYEYDASDLISSVTNKDSISEPTPILPIGTVSSNTADVVIDNIMGEMYEDESVPETFANAVQKGCEVIFDVNVHEPDVAPDATEWTRVLTKYVESKNYGETTMDLSLKDASMVLQGRTPSPMLFQNASVVKVVRSICHNVGFRDVEYDSTDIDPQDFGAQIKYFWTDKEKTAWENLQEIAEVTQTAIYFDEYNRLQIRTRSAAFDLGATTEWIIDADDVSSQDVADQERLAVDVGKFADLISFSEETEEKINYVEVTYTDTEVKPLVRGNPTQVVAWEPEGTLVLRSGRIIEDIPAPDGVSTISVRFNSADIQTWPYFGMFQVDGEVIEYYAKQYSYYDAGGAYNGSYISSLEEKEALDALNEGLSWKNKFSGRVRVKPEGRGAKYTLAQEHTLQGRNWNTHTMSKDGGMTLLSGRPYYTKDFANGYFVLDSAGMSGIDWWTWVVAYPATNPTYTPHLYGTRIKFPTASYAAAGLAISLGGGNSGFYAEVMPTVEADASTNYHEIHMYYLDNSGNRNDFGPNSGQGVRAVITYNTWFDLDVYHTISANGLNHEFSIYINGRFKGTFSKSRASSVSSLTTKNGIFIRAGTRAYFDYHYSYRPSVVYTDGEKFEQSSYLDLATGAYRSTISRDVLASAMSPNSRLNYDNTGMLSDRISDNHLRFEEVGLVGHEVRDFDVKYEGNPMVSSTLYMSNKGGANCTDFVSSPVGARFTLVNSSRRNEVVHGEDTMTFGSSNSVDQKLFVYGRQIERGDNKTAIIEDKPQIVRSGKSEITFDSDWIQSEAQANRIGEWVNSSPAKTSASAEIFGNPFLQLLDIVGIQYADEGRDWRADKYFIISKKVQYDGGLQVDLDLYSLV